LFELGRSLPERQHGFSEDLRRENTKIAMKRAIVGSFLNVLSTGGYYGAYALVLARIMAGGITVGSFMFLANAFPRSRAYIERILSGFDDIMLLRLVRGHWPPALKLATGFDLFTREIANAYSNWLAESRNLATETVAGRLDEARRLLVGWGRDRHSLS